MAATTALAPTLSEAAAQDGHQFRLGVCVQLFYGVEGIGKGDVLAHGNLGEESIPPEYSAWKPQSISGTSWSHVVASLPDFLSNANAQQPGPPGLPLLWICWWHSMEQFQVRLSTVSCPSR